MKTKNLLALTMIATMSFSTMLKADEAIILPVIKMPAALQEGIQRELTQAQIAELLPWAKDSKLFLTDLLDNIQSLSTEDKIDRLVEGIKQAVGESSPKNSELLMRYVLNRGLVIKAILDKEMVSDVTGTSDAKVRVLISSIRMAIKYYDTDMSVLSKKMQSPYKAFGTDYFTFLHELNKSVFDASAQYSIQKTALEWLQWDLYRDLNNAQLAPQILKINNGLRYLPTTKLTDAQSISYIRQMKKITAEIDLVKNTKVSDSIGKDTDEIVKQIQEIRKKEFKAKDRAILNNSVATVYEVFNNGNMKVSEDGSGVYTVWTKSSSIGKGQNCDNEGRVCVGSRITTGESSGKVHEVFSNGKAKVVFDGDSTYSFVSVNKVGKDLPSLKGVGVGSRVNLDSNTGKVYEVFDSGIVKVLWDGDSYYSYAHISKLGY